MPAAQGGLGYGPFETLALMDACGPSLLLEPILSSAVIATALLRRIRDAAAGRGSAARHGDAASASRHWRISIPKRASTRGGSPRGHGAAATGYRLDGHKAVVLHAGLADTLLVSARTAGDASDRGRRVTVFGGARRAGREPR